jgi:hypothetical protein
MLAPRLAEAVRETHADAVGTLTVHVPRSHFANARPELSGKSLLVEDWFDDLVRDYLFPAPSAQQAYDLVFNSDWRERFQALTSLAAPDALASIVATGVAAGKAPAEIAREVRPAVQNVQSSARRIARTEAVRVQHEQQLQTWGQLGD